NDILDFSKVEAGKLDLEEVEFDLRSCIENAVESMAIKAEEKSIELILNLSQIEHCWMIGDPGRIRQIFINLIGNALKFTHSGEIIISCGAQKQGEMYNIAASVKDTGIGIDPKKIDSLFDSFTQADASTTRQYGGTGLGLAICKRLCTMMNGDIEASSKPDQGSEFRFTLTLAACEARTRGIPQTSLNHKRILIVDDNETNREILRVQLQAWGAQVIECGGGEQALDLVKQSNTIPFDVAILDMQMPRMDGAELGEKLHQITPNTGLIMMTSQAMRNDAKRFSALGFKAYFTKPVTMSDLHDALTIVLDNGDCLEQASPLVTTHYIRSLASTDPDIKNIRTFDWGDQQRLLLVEDNAINQEVASLMLEDLGLTTDIASNGLEALTALKSAPKESPYTLILMDCQMPEMDGYAASRAIRDLDAGSRYAVIPIVAMTANAMKGDREKCLDAGMSDYLTKPINPDELSTILVKWIKPKAVSTSETAPAKPTQEIINKTEGSNLQIWNKDSAFRRVGQKESRLIYLIELFLKDMPARMEEIERATNDGDITAILTTAHASKGVALNLSLDNFAKAAKELENSARNGDLEQCVGNYPAFMDCFQQANVELSNYMKTQSTP
ncbi:MAG: response regulator, partial [Cellvibrionaceae bacterium]